MTFSLLSRKRRLKTILQGEANECGLACLAMIANYHRHEIDLSYLRAVFSVSRNGMTMADIVEVAGTLKLDAQGYGLSNVGDLAQLTLPALLHWKGNHFVVLERIEKGVYHVQDPQFGPRSYERGDMERYFSGTALEFEPRLDFSGVKSARSINLMGLLRSTRGLKSTVAQISVVSLTISLLTLATPILLEVALDVVIPQTDLDLLRLLAIGLVVFMLFEAVSRWLRDYITLRAAILLQAQFTRNVVGHATRLPLSFFEARHPSDFVVRLDSIEQIKNNLVTGLVSAVADTLTSFLVIGLMFYYSPAMSLVTLLTLAVVLLIRLLSFPAMRRNTADSLDAHTQERTLLLDGLRRMDTLKVHNSPELFTMKWFESFTRFANFDFRARKAAIDAELLMHAAIAISTVVTLYMGVTGVMTSTLSIGMLYAFFSLRNGFFEKINQLTEQLLHFSIMRVHFQRLDDIIGESAEPGADGAAIDRKVRRTVALDDVTIRFGRGERPLLEHARLSIDIAGQESIAIMGASGAGKSSLLKVIASVHEPAEGRLLVDGLPLDQFGKREFRANLGVVFADDGVFAGTIAENLALFDPGVAIGTMRSALGAVGLLDEIEQLPQGFATLISEESNVLSTGQRRRLLLARALCRNPKLLLLDEITANLDPATEQRVIDGLRRVPAAKIFVTHSEAVLAQVDRTFKLERGRLIEHPTRVSPPPALLPLR